MQTMTPLQAHEQIEKATRSPIVESRHITKIEVGEFARQGDVYVERIRSVTKDWKPIGEHQLAPGTSPGSRHVVSRGPQLLGSPTANPQKRTANGVRLLGPQIKADKDFVIEHPEHAHLCLPPGSYQVSYQLDFNQQRAVRD